MRHSAVVLAALIGGARVASALITGTDQHTEAPQPEILKHAGFEQKLGAAVPKDLTFRDESGAPVHLGQFLGQKPVILVLAYYECPMLCTVVLNAVGEMQKTLPFTLGKDFDIVTVSFDPTDTPEIASKKKANYVTEYKLPDGGRGWHFLTGEQASIKKLADAVGFTYQYDEKAKQYAHATGIMVLTVDGKLSHYFYGVEFPSSDIRLALVEASANRIGSRVDQLILFCYHYDPVSGKYTAAIMNIVRVGCLALIASLGTFMVVMLRRESRLHPAPNVSSPRVG